ncbi:DUF6538 domain-containing protein [Azonexus sp.]|uniref:DUF6538 domain-containing protein n=1 Tax=Azonexus sp. TaxID=1872668 RepID=UPI0035AE8647
MLPSGSTCPKGSIPGSIPYLFRRNDTFFFRITVLQSLQKAVGRELARSLRTSDRRAA